MDRELLSGTDAIQHFTRTPMLGREVEHAEVRELLADPACRLVTVTGRGGVGKTRLAAEVVRAVADGQRRRIVAVPLASVPTPELVLPEIATRLNVPPMTSFDVVEALAQHLQSDELLLVLDNFEHVLSIAPQLDPLLDRCPGLQFLVTSQAPLRLRYERVVALGPLPLPPADVADPGVLAAVPAVALYCEQAAAVDRGFTLNLDNASVVAELCRRLEGLPLAIELAAARAAALPAGEILRRLDERRLSLLRRPRGDAPARHHELGAAIEWTYELLAPDEQFLVRRLSVVSGTFDIDTAEALTGGSSPAPVDVIDALSALVDFHLVDPIPGSDPARFRVPPSIRTFAAEQLELAGETESARRAHVALRAHDARILADAIDSADETATFDALAADHDDFLAALREAIELGMSEQALELLGALAPLWDVTEYHRAHEEQLELTLAQADGLGSVEHANALIWSALLGIRHHGSASRKTLIGQLERGEQLARTQGDTDAVLRALLTWMRISPYTGDTARAERASDEGLVLATTAHHRHWLGRFQVFAGMLAHQRGDHARAAALGREALASARARPSNRTMVLATMLLRPLVRLYPELEGETPTTEEALRVARACGLATYETVLLPTLVLELADHRQTDRALPFAAESLVLARSIPGSHIAGYNLLATSALAARRDDHATAALLHGAVRADLPLLTPTLAPEQADLIAELTAETRAALGDDVFETHAKHGATLSSAAALERALTYVDDLLARAKGRSGGADTARPGRRHPLTGRQEEVLRLLAVGLSNREIAERLDLSPKTVMHHTGAIYRALGVRGRGEAIAEAVRSGLAY